MRLRVARVGETAALEGLHVALAEDAAGLAGLIGLSPEGWVGPIRLAPGDRGRAAATALHDAVEAEALRGGLARLAARVDPDLRPFLESRGWRVVSEAAGEVMMERRAA